MQEWRDWDVFLAAVGGISATFKTMSRPNPREDLGPDNFELRGLW